jgi:hypothetical protein
LRIDPKNRADCDKIYKRFQELDKQCREDELYCVTKLKQAPASSRTDTELELITDVEIDFTEEQQIKIVAVSESGQIQIRAEKRVGLKPSHPQPSVLLDAENSNLHSVESPNSDSFESPHSYWMETEASQITSEVDRDGYSVYSLDTVPPLRQISDRYEAELTEDLLGYLLSVSEDKESLKRVANVMPQHLQRFSRKLGAEQPGQIHREVMRFVHKHRRLVHVIILKYSHVLRCMRCCLLRMYWLRIMPLVLLPPTEPQANLR